MSTKIPLWPSAALFAQQRCLVALLTEIHTGWCVGGWMGDAEKINTAQTARLKIGS